jgi:hypothetical protein
MLTGKTIGQLTYLDIPTPDTMIPVELSGGTYHIDFSAITGNGGGVIETTYSGLVGSISSSTLTTGAYYNITNFKTCYDVPEYYVNGDPKGVGEIDYMQGNVEPIMVLATSNNTISSTAYQSDYPNDRIQYDWTWNQTEITSGTCYGRITERIDEYDNRTDYDHRNIYFSRFQSYNKGLKLTGTINSYNSSTGAITGNGTLFFNEVEIGDILFFDYQGYQVGVRVYSASSNTLIFVVVDPSFGSTINFTGGLIPFYGSSPTNIYNQYKEVYVGQKIEEDFERFLTFNLDGTAIHNYVGDYSKFYIEDISLDNSGFLLANNVFFSNNSKIYSNTIGDRSYNNTSRFWFVRNTISGRFYNNVFYDNGFYSNNIGEYFYNNIVYAQIWSNTIEENFYFNIIYSNFDNNQIGNDFYYNTIYSYFNNNLIGNNFYYNTIYSEFYDNQIGLYFNQNTIGDNGNLDNFGFYRNKIVNNFNNNTIRQNFQNNQIGNKFQHNTVNGNFYKNVIGNGFNYNQNIGYNFYGNHIGNGFNNNDLIGDYFDSNQIGEYFNNNSISYYFEDNQIGNQFENNTLGDTQYFNWDNTSIGNLTGRTYNTFYNSLNEEVDNVILGKELIMNFFSNSGGTLTSGTLVVGETYKITTYFGGGDFSNVANVISGTGNTLGCIFIATGTTPTNWCGTTLTELTSYNEYHKVKFTQWTQYNNGGGFSYERTKVYPTSEPTVYFTKLNYEDKTDFIFPGRLEIARGNSDGIFNQVLEGGWNQSISPEGTEWNSIYTQFYNGSSFVDNIIGNQFKGNYSRRQFIANNIGTYIVGNHFSGDTYDNNIGNYTLSNDFLGSVIENSWNVSFYTNTIGDNFTGNSFYTQNYGNIIGNSFYDNNIQSEFNNNTIGDGFQTNQIGYFFNNNRIDDNFGFGYAQPQGNKIGNNFHDNTIGEYFYNNTISDNFYSNRVSNYFQWNTINASITGTSLASCVLYSSTTVNLFTNNGGNLRLSYFDDMDVLNVESINESACISFTITSSDFVNGAPIYENTIALGVNGTSGFTNTASQGVIDQGYTGHGLTGTSLSQLITAYDSLGFSLSNNVGHLWYVTWGSGSTISQGIVKFGSNVNGSYFDIQTIDTTDTTYLEQNGSGTSLAGTFTFPATFTIFYPLTNKSGWC